MNFRLGSGLRSDEVGNCPGKEGCPIPLIKDKNTPGALAAELSAAKEKRDAKVAAAEETFATQREGVIERGTTRVSEISVLQNELEREKAALVSVLDQA